jgi:hypothetical protein
MLTRIPIAMRESLKALAADPEYGNLRNMCDRLFDQFLQDKPYRNRAFSWEQPAKKGTPGWIAFNVVAADEIQDRVKAEALRLEVSLTTLLYTALLWWIELKKLVSKKPKK